MLAYLQGLSLGLAYVAPIGVQNLFVINASRGRRPTGRRSSSFFLM